MDANTIANIVTPVSVTVIAWIGYLRSKDTQKKLDHVTVVVNSSFTNLEKYVIALKKEILALGGHIPDDQSKGEEP